MTVLEGHKDLGTKKCNPCLVCMLQEQLANRCIQIDSHKVKIAPLIIGEIIILRRNWVF